VDTIAWAAAQPWSSGAVGMLGGSIAQEAKADLGAATNRVFHDQFRPSHLILPIIDRD
jgi:predicted acyl esterase